MISSIEFKNGTTSRMTTTKTYDYLNRLTSIANGATGQALPVSFHYTYNTANQRTRNTWADGSYWVYTYDGLGQVTSGKRYWEDGQPVTGQEFEYGFDDIGNRTESREGGDENGSNLRETTYTSNAFNQYTSRVNPGFLGLMGIAKNDLAVKVNSDTNVYRRGEYFHKELTVANTASLQNVNLTIETNNVQAVTGKVYVPTQNEGFSYDADGDQSSDGRWAYT